MGEEEQASLKLTRTVSNLSFVEASSPMPIQSCTVPWARINQASNSSFAFMNSVWSDKFFSTRETRPYRCQKKQSILFTLWWLLLPSLYELSTVTYLESLTENRLYKNPNNKSNVNYRHSLYWNCRTNRWNNVSWSAFIYIIWLSLLLTLLGNNGHD